MYINTQLCLWIPSYAEVVWTSCKKKKADSLSETSIKIANPFPFCAFYTSHTPGNTVFHWSRSDLIPALRWGGSCPLQPLLLSLHPIKSEMMSRYGKIVPAVGIKHKTRHQLVAHSLFSLPQAPSASSAALLWIYRVAGLQRQAIYFQYRSERAWECCELTSAQQWDAFNKRSRVVLLGFGCSL